MPPSQAPGEHEPPAGASSPPAPQRPSPAPPPPQARKAARLPPPEPALQHRALAALCVALLSLVGFLGFNIEVRDGILIVIYALLAGATALWLALTAMRRARRSRTARPRGSVAATVIAGIGVGLASAMLVAFGMFGHELSGYGQCMSGANTLAAQQSCYDSFSHALNRELGLLGAASRG